MPATDTSRGIFAQEEIRVNNQEQLTHILDAAISGDLTGQPLTYDDFLYRHGVEFFQPSPRAIHAARQLTGYLSFTTKLLLSMDGLLGHNGHADYAKAQAIYAQEVEQPGLAQTVMIATKAAVLVLLADRLRYTARVKG